LRPFDSNGLFRPSANDSDELRRLAVRGAGATVVSRGVSLAIQMAATVILARLLIPADFGVVAMVVSFSSLLMSFPGFTEAVLQWEIIDRHLVSNLFWVCLGVGVLLTGGFAAAGSLLAWFYGDPRVAQIAVVVSLQIFVSSTSILHLGLLQRAMRFPQVSANQVVARAVAVTVSISLALAGWGYWALVLGLIANPVSKAIGAWYLCRWVPSLPRRKPGTGAMLKFVLNVYGRYNIDYLAHNMDNVLVGWRFGAQPLGLYKKAYDLFALPSSLVMQPLQAVAVSALSRLKHDSARYRRYLLRALAVTALLGMGLGADLTLVGHDLISLLLGRGWEESGRIFTLLGPGVGLMFLYGAHSWIHLSIGSANRFFRWGVVEFFVTCLLFAIGLRWGPEGIAVAWTASYGLLTIPAFWYAGRPIRLGITPIIAAIWKYVLASVLAGCATALALQILPLHVVGSGLVGLSIRVVGISGLFLTLYLGGVALLHGGWDPLMQFAMLVREMVVPRRRAESAPTVDQSQIKTGDRVSFQIQTEETTLSGRS
jgi:O-antigen/teichoic acid export membrane protein